MMKIQMLKNQPRPGYFPPLPCYLAGQTYELATTEEIAMGRNFIKAGVAVAVGGVVTVAVSLEVTDEDKATVRDLVQDGKTAEAQALLVSKVKVGKPADAEAVKAVDKALKRAPRPRK